MNNMSCVVRQVNGIGQYIPVADAVNLVEGERIYTGAFRTEIEHDGPSRSHARTICLPLGEVSVSVHRVN